MKTLTLRLGLTILNVLFITLVAFSQGNLEGYVYDLESEGKTTIPQTEVRLIKGDFMLRTITDLDGKYEFENVPAGIYNLEVVYFTNTVKEEGVVVEDNGVVYYTLEIAATLTPTGEKEAIVRGFTTLFDPREPTMDVKNAEFIKNTPVQNVNQLVTLSPSTTTDAKGNISFRGARPGDAVYYIDGQRSAGTLNIPLSSIYKLKVISGGIPASYGETTGGVIIVETKSFFNTFN